MVTAGSAGAQMGWRSRHFAPRPEFVRETAYIGRPDRGAAGMNDKPDPFKAAKDAATSGQRFSRGVADSAQQIWLAGLGALSRTQQEGGKFFDALVEEGVRIQEKTHAFTQDQVRQAHAQTEPWVEAARKRTSAAMGKLEQVFDARIAAAMKRMQMPDKSDLETLSARIDALAREVRAARKPAARPRAAAKRAKPKT
jgi:poly(hydroxyalkanoate) granule-associated protein